MAHWSPENATRAYLNTVKMGKRAKEPDVAEFVSALAAGSNAQLMVVACGSGACSTTLALVAAAHQTGGRVVCILPGIDELNLSKKSLGLEARHVEFVTGEAQSLLMNGYREADFVMIDCQLKNHERVFEAVQAGERVKTTTVLGYNAFHKGSWSWGGGSETHLLPIGEGLLMTRIAAKSKVGLLGNGGINRKSHWVVRVDKCTGEEHVFRIRSPQAQGRVIEA